MREGKLSDRLLKSLRSAFGSRSALPVVHLLHIGKTGGTAIKEALEPFREGGRYTILLHAHERKLRDVPLGEAVIFFVRDPITRFVSGFYSRQRQGQPRYLSPWSPEEAEAFGLFHTPNELAAALSDPDPERREGARRAMLGIQHVRNSYWEWFEDEEYLASRRRDILFVGFQEALASDFALLCSMLGLPEGIALPKDDVKAHRNPSGLDRKLTEAATENLRSWYARDYLFLALCREIRAAPDARS